MMKRGEKQKLIDQSLVACHLNAEAPRDRGEVRLYELSKARFFFDDTYLHLIETCIN